jgi:carbonic anhydrase
MQRQHGIRWIAGLAAVLIWSGTAVADDVTSGNLNCSTQHSKACQDARTAAQVLERLQRGNDRFVAGKPKARDYAEQIKATAKHQYPLASVVSCMDARAPAEIVFDQGIGDMFNIRVAGNIINDDVLGSLEYGSRVAGSKLIVIMGHTGCGAVKGACDNVELGHVTGLLDKIKPARDSIAIKAGVDRSSKNYAFVDEVALANVRQGVQAIRNGSPILREMEDKGEIDIVGAMYDITTGKVSWYDTGSGIALKK